jgi:hypothetical protein
MQQNPEKAASATSKDTNLQLGHNNWTHWPTPEIHTYASHSYQRKNQLKNSLLVFTHSTDIYRQLHIDQVNSLLNITRRRLQYLGKNCEDPQIPMATMNTVIWTVRVSTELPYRAVHLHLKTLQMDGCNSDKQEQKFNTKWISSQVVTPCPYFQFESTRREFTNDPITRLHRFKITQSIIKPEKEETQTLKYKEKTEDWFEQ